MTSTAQLSTEMTLLAWSTVLLFVHIMLQATTVTRERGTTWNAGARDAQSKPLGAIAGRAQRALDNFKETYPAFIALALALELAGRNGGLGLVGAAVWIVARIVYIPLYMFGVPYVRTLCWTVSIVGLALMLTHML